MPFFRQDGERIALLHGIPGPEGLEQRLLHSFQSREQLRAVLADGVWASFCLQVEQRHPEVAPDWNEVRSEGYRLLEHNSPDSGGLPLKLKRALRYLARELKRIDPETPSGAEQLGALGPELKRALLHGVVLLERARGLPADDAHELARSIVPDPVEVEEILAAAREALEKRQWRRAADLFQEAREEDPFDPDVLNAEGLGWLDRQRYPEGERCFAQARALARSQLPQGDGVYSWMNQRIRPYLRATYNLALCFEFQGHYDEALALFLDCLQRCPEDGVSARFHLGPIYQRQGKLETALRRYREDLTGNLIDLPDPYFDGASVLIQLNREPEAVEWILRGTALNGHFLKVLTGKPRKTRLREFCPTESLDWALAYAHSHRDLWSGAGIDLLIRVRRDAAVSELVQRLALIQLELDHEIPTARRRVLAIQATECREALRSPALAAGLLKRLSLA